MQMNGPSLKCQTKGMSGVCFKTSWANGTACQLSWAYTMSGSMRPSASRQPWRGSSSTWPKGSGPTVLNQ